MRMLFYCTVLAVTIAHVVTEETFCGDKLNKVLRKFCILHNAPDHRMKRQIVTECCYNKCSVKYLVANYCQIYNREALDKYLKKFRRIIRNEGSKKSKHPSLDTRKRRKVIRCSCKNRAHRKRLPHGKILLLKRNWNVPSSKLGHIEEDQRPFYVLNRI